MPIRNSINNQSTGFTVNAPTSGTALTVTGATGSFAADFTGTNAGGISVSQSNGGTSSYQAIQSSADLSPVYFYAFKNRAGGDINAGDILMQHNVYGYRGAYQIAGAMRCYSETVGATKTSGAFDWFTTSTAGVFGQRLYLSSDGAVVINTPAAAQTALTVNGYNATGTYGAQLLAVVPGALFDGIRVLNNTATAGSSSQIECAVSSQALTTGGDPYLRFVNYGVYAISIGLDTSTQQYAMTSGSGVGGANNFFTWTIANNQINLPLQASFHAYSGANQLNVTGAGAAYIVQFGVERYDVSNSYDGVSTFTAPATGKYFFSTNVRIDGITALMTGAYIQFLKNGVPVGLGTVTNPANTNYAGLITLAQTFTIDLAAGDTMQVQIIVLNGAANSCTIFGTGEGQSYFCGQLLS